MTYPKRYPKDLTHLTTFRLSSKLREDANSCAEYLGISFSDFLRQSLTRNIHVSRGIEEEVSHRAVASSEGKLS